MHIYILNIGNELLNGDTVNTNAAWLGDFFSQRGLQVIESSCVRDREQSITNALDDALNKASLVIITGGLGPTHDDITKKTLASYFQCGMYQDQSVLEHVTDLFAKRGIPMQPINKMQADIPEKAEVLFNDLGTAPGLWFQLKNQAVVSLPGVPYEMKFLVKERIWPLLSERFGLNSSVYRSYFRTAGIGESSLSELYLPKLSTMLKNEELSLAYLPSAGEVKLRVNTLGNTLKEAKQKAAVIEEYIKNQVADFIYSQELDEELPEAVGRRLLNAQKTLATAESCTGGDIASAITNVPGSSAYFKGSIVAYHNQVKTQLLNVPDSVLANVGAVSKEVALIMAKEVALKCGSDYGISTTGVAGPGGGSDEKPVGLVWFGFYGPNVHFALKAYLSKDRMVNKLRSVKLSLECLRRILDGIESTPFELPKHTEHV